MSVDGRIVDQSGDDPYPEQVPYDCVSPTTLTTERIMTNLDASSPTTAKPVTGEHPLGPLLLRTPVVRKTRGRVISAAILVACVALLTTAASISPDREGLGSHRQLGLPACSVVVLTGYPCPTCGMTTAFTFAVRGRFLSAFHAHPGGLCVALAVAGAGVVALVVLITGKRWAVNWYRVSPARVALGGVLLVLGGWVYKLAIGLATGALPMGN